MIQNNLPFTEKYRPKEFDNIILDEANRIIFENILETNNFPNILLHGPPGTGKTTTIINLINKYQEKYLQKSNSLIIHLNASDDRGIDVIRNNIYNFVISDNLFNNGIKFVILDEVDYMTKIAQQALKCLIQYNVQNVRYCLICNYISKIDKSLISEFIKIRFNKLDKNSIFNYLNNINNIENINLNDKQIIALIDYFDSDIRCMLNYMQSNINTKINILDNSVMCKLYEINISQTLDNFKNNIILIENKYKLSISQIIKTYLTYIINYKRHILTNKLICEIELIIHNINNDYLVEYVYYLFI